MVLGKRQNAEQISRRRGEFARAGLEEGVDCIVSCGFRREGIAIEQCGDERVRITCRTVGDECQYCGQICRRDFDDNQAIRMVGEPVGKNAIPRATSTEISPQVFAAPAYRQASFGHVS